MWITHVNDDRSCSILYSRQAAGTLGWGKKSSSFFATLSFYNIHHKNWAACLSLSSTWYRATDSACSAVLQNSCHTAHGTGNRYAKRHEKTTCTAFLPAFFKVGRSLDVHIVMLQHRSFARKSNDSSGKRVELNQNGPKLIYGLDVTINTKHVKASHRF